MKKIKPKHKEIKMGDYKRTNPADVANLYVRNVLCDLSEAMGSFSEEELKKTLKFFNYKCPYTGEDLRELVEHKKYELDHLIPQNREGCGLHLYGNVVPISHDTNSKKSKKKFEDFIRNNTIGTKEEKEARIRKIKEFQEKSGFNKKFLPVEAKIKDYCKRKYQSQNQCDLSYEMHDSVFCLHFLTPNSMKSSKPKSAGTKNPSHIMPEVSESFPTGFLRS